LDREPFVEALEGQFGRTLWPGRPGRKRAGHRNKYGVPGIPDTTDGVPGIPNATLVGGLDRNATLVHGTPAKVQEEALDAFEQAGRKGFMLGAGCTIPVVTP